MSNISEATDNMIGKTFGIMKTLLSTWMVVSVEHGRLNQHLTLRQSGGKKWIKIEPLTPITQSQRKD